MNLNQHLAEKQEISILPTFRLNTPIRLVNSTRVGPFFPQTPAKVPIWLALLLKKQNKCKIIVPEWLSSEYLISQRRMEKESSKEEYGEIPAFHHREIAYLLLKHAPDDFEDCDLVRSLLEDVDNLRSLKIRFGVKQQISKQQTEETRERVLNLTNLSALEVIEFRPFLTNTMDMFAMLSQDNEQQRSRISLYSTYGESATTTSAATAAMAVDLNRPVKKLRRFR